MLTSVSLQRTRSQRFVRASKREREPHRDAHAGGEAKSLA